MVFTYLENSRPCPLNTSNSFQIKTHTLCFLWKCLYVLSVLRHPVIVFIHIISTYGILTALRIFAIISSEVIFSACASYVKITLCRKTSYTTACTSSGSHILGHFALHAPLIPKLATVKLLEMPRILSVRQSLGHILLDVA